MASHWGHILDSRIVRDFQVGFILAVKDAHRTEKAGGFVDMIIGISEDSIVGSIAGVVIGSAIIDSMISRRLCDLSLFLFLPFSVVDDMSAVV
jgi:hypothetical protein